MAHRLELLDIADSSRAEFDESLVLEKVRGAGLDRLRSDICGSHTLVVYPPLNSYEPFDIDEVVAPAAGTNPNLYVHLPWCEYQCPFCSYETRPRKISKPISKEEKTYIRLIELEWNTWQKRLGDAIANSLYIGGGTPTALPTHLVVELIGAISQGEAISALCVECSPLSLVAKPDCLRALSDAGATRFSLGIQSFDSDVLKAARGYNAEVAINAANIVAESGQLVNLDMIQDLPGQTEESVINDLLMILKLKPAQVTWYTMRLSKNASWRRQVEKRRVKTVCALESLRRRWLINRCMATMGYAQRPGGRFTRDDIPADDFKRTRADLKQTLLGLGVSAYSHFPNHVFRNTHSHSGVAKRDLLGDYERRIYSAGTAVSEGKALTKTDRILCDLITGVRSVLSEEVLGKAISTIDIYTDRVKPLIENDLLIKSSDGFVLSEVGRLVEEEICASFIEPRHQFIDELIPAAQLDYWN